MGFHAHLLNLRAPAERFFINLGTSATCFIVNFAEHYLGFELGLMRCKFIRSLLNI